MIKALDGHTVEPRFDWYQFSTTADLKILREVLEPMAANEPFTDTKPVLTGYAWSTVIGGVGGSVRVQWGGRNGDQYGANVQGTGPLSPQVADLIRAAGLPHKVGRADVCLDFIGPFDQCRLRFIERCNTAGMESRDNGSCPESTSQNGRTVYGGAVSSFYRPTLYEKGRQLGPDHPVDFLRLEHRFAPTKSAEKAQLSELSPAQMIGCRPVARELSQVIAEYAAAPHKLTKQSKENTPYYWMLRQYRRLLVEMHQDHGSWPAVGAQIGLDLADIEEELRT